MPPFPSPLHPAVVHFPIVLILLGAGVAIVAAFVRRWQLPWTAAILLSLGALGAIVAVQTGESDGEMVGEKPATESLLDGHETWAKRTQTVAVIGAVVALAAAAAASWPAAARLLGIGTAVVAIGAAWCVFQTGHRGGQLVYQHGAGVFVVSGETGATSGKAPAKPEGRARHRDDD
jgi:uncharacterized membrane protein